MSSSANSPMTHRALLEISVESLDAALAAVRGGADRIELCEDLSLAGVTPNPQLMRQAREQISVPIFAMIRPRAGDFCYSAAEFHQMKQEIALAKSSGMDGLVFGILTSSGAVDIPRTSDLVRAGAPLPVTFHRAFDELASAEPDALSQGLEDVIATGATRLLTSGGQPSAEEGALQLAGLLRQARGRITILPGGGIRPANLRKIAQAARANEFHSGLSNLLPTSTANHNSFAHRQFEDGVRALIKVLEEEARQLQPAALPQRGSFL